MPESLGDLAASDSRNRIGPDLFGFYAHQVADMLSQDEDILPASKDTEAANVRLRISENGKGRESLGNSLFVNCFEDALPDLKRELLKALLRQSVKDYTMEVDEMLDPAVRIRQMLSVLRSRKNDSRLEVVPGLEAREGSSKKIKVLSSSSETSIPVQPESGTEDMHPKLLCLGLMANLDKATSDRIKCARCATTITRKWRKGVDGSKISNVCSRCLAKGKESKDRSALGNCKEKLPLQLSKEFVEEAGDVDDDFRFLLETGNSQPLEETVKKHSDEMSHALSHMEQQLEELIDNVVSKCRAMTQPEKHQLLKEIQNLHPKNLDRVVEIINRKRPTEPPSSDEVFVDLETQENITLWRLHFYVQAVESARKLSS